MNSNKNNHIDRIDDVNEDINEDINKYLFIIFLVIAMIYLTSGVIIFLRPSHEIVRPMAIIFCSVLQLSFSVIFLRDYRLYKKRRSIDEVK